jgi:prephenate dehydrogenase
MGRVVADGDFADFTGFQAIGIVGLGLIGGSLALAIRERWPAAVIVGVDRPEVIAEARARGVIADAAPSAGALAMRPLDVIVLAAPVLQNEACLREIAEASRAAIGPRSLLVTDVGSTKESITVVAREAMAISARLMFIGGHPIAGAAHGGLGHARADLFRGKPWLFTPATRETAQGATRATSDTLDELRAFVRALGAVPSTLDAAEHDRIMAYVSHLPQLAASSLMRVAGEGAGAPGLALSGAGLADTTRLASSPASMWTEILQSNADHIRLALDAFIEDLERVRNELTSPAAASWFDAGARWRARLGNGARID